MKRQLLVGAGWLMVSLVVVLSLVPLPQVAVPYQGADKWHHLIAYAGLALWFLHLYPDRPWQVGLGLLILGLLVEVAQSFTGYRYMEGMDVVMNVLGLLLAFFVFYALKLRLRWLMKAQSH